MKNILDFRYSSVGQNIIESPIFPDCSLEKSEQISPNGNIADLEYAATAGTSTSVT